MSVPSKKYYGVIGNPIKHSKSPEIHNAWFKQYHIDGIYEPFLVEDVAEFVKAAKQKPLAGFNITVPHKESILEFCDSHSDAVKAIGAANTVVLESNSEQWRADNTDYLGFLKVCDDDLKISLEAKRVLLIGAGGSAKAILYALLLRKAASIVVVNRSEERAETLIKGMCASFSKTPMKSYDINYLNNRVFLEGFDVIVHTTSVGLYNRDDCVFNDFSWMLKKPIVIDILYQDTKLLKEAKRLNCLVSGGFPMLLYQAQYAFELFTGVFPETLSVETL